jgi:peptidoglycan L-alanyl-D-glutamate endopeptidase CwlK
MTSASLQKLKTCHPDLVKLIMAVDLHYPVQVICGHRNSEDQQKAFDEGKSKKKPGQSKHNLTPSHAVDIVPDPDRNPRTISWVDLKEFEIMCHVVEQMADDLEIKIKLGRDYPHLVDWPHVELVS